MSNKDDETLEESESPPVKKMKLETSPELQKSLIYIVEKKISSRQLSLLKEIGCKKGITIADSVSENVTHVVTKLDSIERLTSTLSDIPASAEIITLDWLTSSFAEGHLLQVTDRYRLRKNLKVTVPTPTTSVLKETTFTVPEYECQRVTLLKHHNHLLTDALELLERYYQYLDHKEGDSRALAFRQASCTLKVLPKKVEDIREISHLPRIGKHSGEVIEDILSTGSSREVEECRESKWFQCMELFTGIYGCGSATANKWYTAGLRTIKDVQTSKDLHLTDTQKLGLAYYEHLSLPVTRLETEIIIHYIQQQVEVCVPGTTVEAVGGYRRGKPHGHDVDILLSNPDSTVTDSLLTSLLAQLRKQDVLIHSEATTGHNVGHMSMAYSSSTKGANRRAKFDNLDKAFCILRLPQTANSPSKEQNEEECEPVPHLVKRVDFIISPPEQYPFALVSWTGSKQFNRSLRRYSAKELNMIVNAHSIYDISQGKSLSATNEREIFSILKLDYREPWERNC